MPAGWGKIPGHEVAFSDRLPFLLTTEVRLPPFVAVSLPQSEHVNQILGHSIGCVQLRLHLNGPCDH